MARVSAMCSGFTWCVRKVCEDLMGDRYQQPRSLWAKDLTLMDEMYGISTRVGDVGLVWDRQALQSRWEAVSEVDMLLYWCTGPGNVAS